jgi:hypothetical protein
MSLNPQYLGIAVTALIALAVIGLIAAGVRRAQSERLREHFGTEYNRTLKAAGSRTAAERELVNRAEEVKSFDIHPLMAVERDSYRHEWKAIEARFVDRPTTAVVQADELIDSVMRARGYPMAEFEEHAVHLSVQHPKVVEHYRAGHAVMSRGAATTEDLRKAMLHYHALFEELVGMGGTDVAQDIVTQSEVAARPRQTAERIEREEEELRR